MIPKSGNRFSDQIIRPGKLEMRLLRIVPDNTKFDFMRFRRISFPLSALMSILAISLYFFHGLNFGIDFKGGTVIEVQTKAGTADLAHDARDVDGLGLGEVQLQQFGAPERRADPRRRTARRRCRPAAAVTKVRGALGNAVDYRRVEVVGPRVSGELLSYGVDRAGASPSRHHGLHLVPFRMAVRARRHDRQRA